MSIIDSLILGIIQGLTEFLPISSSSHLKLAKLFLNVPPDVMFDLICNAGTLLALVLFLMKELYFILTKKPLEILWFAVATLPLFPMYFLGHRLFTWAADPHFLGFFLMITSLILFL
ncbi:MAG: undecaprenyl-diphosphate phosphatase, partial [Chlamydiota bacterium]